jgi:AraC-like DNA-binding protein/ligand-binding sensor protein
MNQKTAVLLEEKAVGKGTFKELTNLPLLRRYEDSFVKATGVPFKLVGPDAKNLCLADSNSSNSLCSLVAESPLGCKSCGQTQKRMKGLVERKLRVHQSCCFAGLTEVAIPVLQGRRHVGTLISGQVFKDEPNKLDFEMLAKRIGRGLGNAWKEKARKAYFKTQVMPMEKFHAITELLHVFAQHLPEDATQHSIAASTAEPVAVSNAKQFIRSHFETEITLDMILQHVHVSRFYFCKIFKKATGMTLTEYTARVRIETAKTLLLEHALRISDVAFASGFGSIPQFNNVFSRMIGMSPTDYRVMRREK